MSIRCLSAILTAMALFCLSAAASDKQPKTYPLHGTIIAMHAEVYGGSSPVYTDPYGKTHGGGSTMRRVPIYTIRTEDMEYEVAARRADHFNLGDQIDFRLEGRHLFIREGDKDERRSLMGQRMRDQPATPQPQH